MTYNNTIKHSPISNLKNGDQVFLTIDHHDYKELSQLPNISWQMILKPYSFFKILGVCVATPAVFKWFGIRIVWTNIYT